MRSGIAWRFIGSIGETFTEISRLAPMVESNPIFVAVEAGKVLLDCVSNVVTMISEKQKTQVLKTETYCSKLFLDTLVASTESQANMDITSQEEHATKQYGNYKNTINHTADELILKINNEFKIAEEKLRLQSEEKTHSFYEKSQKVLLSDKQLHLLRELLYDTIQFSTQVLHVLNEEPVKNKFRIAEVEEKKREAYASYSRAFRNII